MMVALGLASTDATEDVAALKAHNWKRDLRGGPSVEDSDSEDEEDEEEAVLSGV